MSEGPRRTCIGCRRVRAKSELIRLVRGGDGRVKADREGGAPGRGAYVCPDDGCLRKALVAGRLTHALKSDSRPPGDGVAEILDIWRRR